MGARRTGVSGKGAQAALLVAGLLSAPVLSAADFYVSPDGSDSAAGTLAAPVQTIERGKALADAALGGTVYILDGTYAPKAQMGIESGKSVYFVGYSKDPTRVVISGKNMSARLFYNWNKADFALKYVTVIETTCEAGGSAVNIARGRIANCIFRDNTGGAASTVYIDGDTRVENCLFYRNSGYATTSYRYGAQLQIGNYDGYTASGAPIVLNCTFISDDGTRNIYNGTTKFLYPNNIGPIQGRVINCVDIGDGYAASYPDASSNYLHCAGTYDRSGATQWVKIERESAIDSDYRPTASSPLVDAGSTALYDTWATTAASAAFDLVLNRRLRGISVDIGAYEFGAVRISAETTSPEVGFLRWYSNACDETVWTFGDGGSAVGSLVYHAYSAAGNYTPLAVYPDADTHETTTNRLPITVVGKTSPVPWIAYRADDVTVDADGRVTDWPNRTTTAAADLSTSSTALTLGTYGGKPAVIFTGGSGDCLKTAGSLSAVFTDGCGAAFYVGRYDGGTDAASIGNRCAFALVDSTSTGKRIMYFNYNGSSPSMNGVQYPSCYYANLRFCDGDGTTEAAILDGPLSSTGEIVSGVLNGKALAVWRNGRPVCCAQYSSGYETRTGPFSIGSAQLLSWVKPFVGPIAEVRIYTRNLTAQQRFAVECSLASRYGMTLTDTDGGRFSFGGDEYPDFDLDPDALGSPKNAWLTSDGLSGYARSGALAVAFASTPATDTNAFVYVAHDAAKSVRRPWAIVGASGAHTVGLELTFSTTDDFAVGDRKDLERRDGSRWVFAGRGISSGGAVRFSLPPEWSNGLYRLAVHPGLVFVAK